MMFASHCPISSRRIVDLDEAEVEEAIRGVYNGVFRNADLLALFDLDPAEVSHVNKYVALLRRHPLPRGTR